MTDTQATHTFTVTDAALENVATGAEFHAKLDGCPTVFKLVDKTEDQIKVVVIRNSSSWHMFATMIGFQTSKPNTYQTRIGLNLADTWPEKAKP